jgi:hypothetical protein
VRVGDADELAERRSLRNFSSVHPLSAFVMGKKVAKSARKFAASGQLKKTDSGSSQTPADEKEVRKTAGEQGKAPATCRGA